MADKERKQRYTKLLNLTYKPNLYDLVVLDIALPNMNGFELHKKYKR
jgi:DNA-binding response OmpR family regulator